MDCDDELSQVVAAVDSSVDVSAAKEKSSAKRLEVQVSELRLSDVPKNPAQNLPIVEPEKDDTYVKKPESAYHPGLDEDYSIEPTPLQPYLMQQYQQQ